MKFLLVLVILSISIFTFAGTGEIGKISEIYTDDSGNIAVKLENGFPNAGQECPSHNGWAGNKNAPPILKSTLLAAKASGSTVSLSIYGCDGSWLKVKGVYVK